MPLRFIGGFTREQAKKFGIVSWLWTWDNAANNEFNGIYAIAFPATWDPVEANVAQRIPCNIVVDRMFVRISNAPGAGTSRTFTLRDDGANTALTVTLVAGTTGEVAGAVAIASGSAVSIGHTLTGAPAACTWMTIMVLYHIE